MKNVFLAVSLLLTTSVGFTSSLFATDTAEASDVPKSSRIVGGVKSLPNAWPSTVAILDASIANISNNFQAQYCGGSVVGSHWILTAAHCVTNEFNGNVISPDAIYTLVGTSDLDFGGTSLSVRNIFVHPDYNHNNYDSDLALLELESSVPNDVPAISISANDAPDDLLATVVGWGTLEHDSGDFPVELYEVEVPIVNRSICEQTYDPDDLTVNMICAGYENGGKDACQRDSGGPLMGIQHDEYVQIGITSWGVGCAQPEFYGVYTRLSKFESWIRSYTGAESYPSGGNSSWSNFFSSGGGSFDKALLLFLGIMSVLLVRRSFRSSVKGSK